jgi:tRNA(fMet)-specific endonuclease VapC
MILLDTDHLSVVMDERDQRHNLLMQRLAQSAEQIACSIISVEGIFRGWMAVIHRARDVYRQLPAYFRFGQILSVVKEWEISPFDEQAADQYELLRRQRIRIGTMDLKIASIALSNKALLVSANLRDFSLVPNLRCEDWLRV